MVIMKLLVKAVVLPVALLLWALKWIGLFFTSMSHWVFELAAGLLFTLVMVCILFGQAERSTTIQAIAVSMVLFVIPYAAEWFVVRIGRISTALFDFVRL